MLGAVDAPSLAESFMRLHTTVQCAGSIAPDPMYGGQKQVHRNSLQDVGDSHVYKMVDVENNQVYKTGESSGRIRMRDGKSLRAESQVRRLARQFNRPFESTIMAKTNGKAASRATESRLIAHYRSIYEQDKIPGNENN